MQRRFLIAATIALLGAGCSFLLDTAEPTQCSTNADCEANPSLRNRVCQSGFCTIPGVPDPGVRTPDSGPGCVSTELCTQANSGQLSVCRTKGRPCEPWQNEQCRLVSSPALAMDPNAIVIGSILPFTVQQVDKSKPPSAYADRVRRAIDLAASEFATALAGGIFLTDGKRHPLAVIHCDSSQTAEGAKLALKHLVGTVRVPALIVGADDDIVTIANEPDAKKTAIACEGCIGDLPQGLLAWRIVPRLALEAPMVNWRVSKLEQEIRALPSPPTAIKVALLTANERATTAFVSKLKDVLRFNGDKSVGDNGTSFKTILAADPRFAAVDHSKMILELLEFEPDIVVVAMGGDFGKYYLPGLEAQWTSARRPFYIATDLNYTKESWAAVGQDEGLRKRISGTRPGYAVPLQANITDFVGRYGPVNNYKDPDGNFSGYDAFYSLGMALLASSQQPVVDGVHISAGFERLIGGTTLIDFRPQNVAVASALLLTAAPIDVRGLWSDLDWSLTTHDLDSDVSMYCLKRDGTSSIVLEPNAGPRLSFATGAVDGAYTCD